jgi:hypothetical protein
MKNFVFGDGDGGGGSVAAPAAAPAVAPSPGGGVTATAPVAAPAAPAKEDTPGYWAPDWRERLAAGDDKAAKQLARYGSPEDIWKKARSLEARLTSGELKPTLPKNATVEELSEYRKAVGIPDKPDAYDLKGLTIDESDKGLMSHVLSAAHSANMTPDQTKAIASVWPKIKQEAFQAQHERDVKLKTESEDSLRGEWGNEYRRNMGLVQQLLVGAGDSQIMDLLTHGRLGDGTPIGSSPAVLKMLLGVALQANPTGTLVPNGGGNPMGTVTDEITKIEKTMRENRDAYNKDEKMQERYRSLLEARENLKARS